MAELTLKLTTGSLVVGGFCLLFLLTLAPRPNPVNLLWMLAVAFLVAVGQRPPALALFVPLAVFGSISMVVLAVALAIPLD